jgi:hypothetical protein
MAAGRWGTKNFSLIEMNVIPIVVAAAPAEIDAQSGGSCLHRLLRPLLEVKINK